MPYSRNINTYGDVLQVLQTARAHNGLRYTLPTPGLATHWRGRAFMYRSLLVKAARERLGQDSLLLTTDWDDMIITTDGPVCVIKFAVPLGSVTTLDGKEVPIEKAGPITGEAEKIVGGHSPLPPDDPLVAEAERLLKELGQ